MPQIGFLGTTHWIVPTLCHECYIDVESSERNDDHKWISIGLLSTHVGYQNNRLVWKLREMWKILRNGVPTVFEMDAVEEIDDLIAALNFARNAAFGGKDDN